MTNIWTGKRLLGKTDLQVIVYMLILVFIRMARLEILDELEEWYLLSAHYCVAWAFKSVDYEEEFFKVQLQCQPQTSIVFNK